MPRGEKWTEDEIDILRKLYPTTKSNNFQGFLKRSPKAIRLKAAELGIIALPAYHEPRTWSPIAFNPFEHLSLTERAYIAGIVDGEGHFRQRSRRTKDRRKIQNIELTVTNTNVELLHWLRDKVGGHVYQMTEKNSSWKSCFYWYLGGTRRVKALLILLEPYLIVKKEAADKVLKAWQPYLFIDQRKAM